MVEKSSDDRKFLKDGSREVASSTLGEKRAYVFVEIKKNPEDENAEEEPVKI